jgi:hypothetical protein
MYKLLVVKWLGQEADHSPPFRAKFKDAWLELYLSSPIFLHDIMLNYINYITLLITFAVMYKLTSFLPLVYLKEAWVMKMSLQQTAKWNVSFSIVFLWKIWSLCFEIVKPFLDNCQANETLFFCLILVTESKTHEIDCLSKSFFFF